MNHFVCQNKRWSKTLNFCGLVGGCECGESFTLNSIYYCGLNITFRTAQDTVDFRRPRNCQLRIIQSLPFRSTLLLLLIDFECRIASLNKGYLTKSLKSNKMLTTFFTCANACKEDGRLSKHSMDVSSNGSVTIRQRSTIMSLPFHCTSSNLQI